VGAAGKHRQMGVDGVVGSGLAHELTDVATIAEVRPDIDGLQRRRQIRLSGAAPHLGNDGLGGPERLGGFERCGHERRNLAPVAIGADQWTGIDDHRKYWRAASSSSSVRTPDSDSVSATNARICSMSRSR